MKRPITSQLLLLLALNRAMASDRARFAMENAVMRQVELEDGDIIATPVLGVASRPACS